MSHVILLALAPIFFVMALGFGAGRLHRIDNHHVAQLNALVMEFSVPAALFVATASASRSEMIQQGGLFAIVGVAMLIPYLLWYYCRLKFFKLRSDEAAVEALTVSLPSFAAAGLPMLSAILGPKEAVHVAIAIAAGSIIPSPIALVFLELSSSKGQATLGSVQIRVCRAFWSAFAKPIVFSPILGLAFSMLGFGTGDVLSACFQLIGMAAGGAALFLTGLILSAQPFRLDATVIVATAVANTGQPLLVALIVFVAHVPAAVGKVAILLAALPAGFFGILFAVKYKVASAEIGSMVIASTLVSAVTLAVAISILYPR